VAASTVIRPGLTASRKIAFLGIVEGRGYQRGEQQNACQTQTGDSFVHSQFHHHFPQLESIGHLEQEPIVIGLPALLAFIKFVGEFANEVIGE
jgi:hypothetical protein